MKRGKDDEKIMGPMFPRLHVNDTERGGPRAPPRNKMALYEQLTIPSQRYNSGAVAPKQNNNSSSSLVPSTSTSQGNNRERNTYFPLHQPPSAPAYDEIEGRNADAVSLNNQPVRVENKKRPLEEDDFMVPIFSQVGSGMYNGKTQRIDGEGRSFLNSSHQELIPRDAGEDTNLSNSGHHVSKQQIVDQGERSLRVSATSRNSLDISMRGSDGVPWQKDASMLREHQKKHRMSGLETTSACLLEDHGDSLPAVDAYDEDVPDLQGDNSCKDTSLRLRLNPQAGCGFRGDDDTDIGNGGIDNDQYLEKESVDRGDDVSETSIVDSASEFDISPDDVVDIIGRKHFWKARSAIVNQQRVFAVQVFELHRLLKVQKLIAGSPNLLLEATAFVGKSSLKGSTVKKYSSEYVVKSLPPKSTQRDVGHRSMDKVEGTAENAVPKAPALVSPQHPIQPGGYPSFSSNTALSPPVSMDPKMNPWGFHQPSGHQWLVPVMSPSEGLVYKPFPAPGFMGPVCGGCGPACSHPAAGNAMNPTYGTATPQYQQGMGIAPGMHFSGQGYFPPYGMPMMSQSVSGSTVDQLNQFSGSNPYNQTGQPDGASLNYGAQPKSSLNVHTQENVISPHAAAPKERELQGSTASSPTDRAQRIGMDHLSESRDAVPHFVAPPTTEVPMDSPGEKQARVIRVVPHRSTRESAARIFQSIQQQRQVYESS